MEVMSQESSHFISGDCDAAVKTIRQSIGEDRRGQDVGGVMAAPCLMPGSAVERHRPGEFTGAREGYGGRRAFGLFRTHAVVSENRASRTGLRPRGSPVLAFLLIFWSARPMRIRISSAEFLSSFVRRLVFDTRCLSWRDRSTGLRLTDNCAAKPQQRSGGFSPRSPR
jgi:hypothetical protein